MTRSLKTVFAVLAGFVIWFIVATVANRIVRASIPGYAEVESAMRFTLPMLLARLVVGGLASLGAGFACASIERRDLLPVKILAALLVLFFLPVHYSLWAAFPWWYHALFLASLAPLVWFGARLRPK